MTVEIEAHDESPFHTGERQAQAKAGESSKGTGIRHFMLPQHRKFFSDQRYIFGAVADGAGWPVAFMVEGENCFVCAPDANRLRVEAWPIGSDPVRQLIEPKAEIGLLGIDFTNRRRNRANGTVDCLSTSGFEIDIRESFGNCPKYIQMRSEHLCPSPKVSAGNSGIEIVSGLSDAAARIITQSDTLFIATRSGSLGGLDISHRGGRPGFVEINERTLALPDFPGNRYFNTLGNLLLDERASLLVIEFSTGTLVRLKVRVRIDWHDPNVATGRKLTFDIEETSLIPNASRYVWSGLELTPSP